MADPDGAVSGHAWRFDVAKNFSNETAGDEMSLEFAGVEGIPDGAEAHLIDRRLQRLVDIKKEIQYSFYLGERPVVSEDDCRFTLLVGSEEFIGSYGDQMQQVPIRTALHQNYPNPFNPATIIRYELAKAGRVELRIYDVTGALVRVLENRKREPGRYEVGWNGQNERGGFVSSGVYFYRLKTDGFSKTRKMLLLK
jgi:hypothetical protein